MFWLSEKFTILRSQEMASGKIIVKIHGISVYDLSKGGMEVHVEVVSLFLYIESTVTFHE